MYNMIQLRIYIRMYIICNARARGKGGVSSP